MKVGVLGTSGVELVDRPEPTIGPGELLVELAACGICGTDLEKVRGNYASAGILGHEPVGRIVSAGDGVEGLKVGDRVFVHHHVPCYQCEICRRGEFTYCPSYGKSNLDPGGFAERFRVSKEHVDRKAAFRLDDKISWDIGALLEPAGCAFTALRKVGLQSGDTVFLVGLGPVGLLLAALAKSMGARWVGGSDLSPMRRELATRFGVDATVDARDPGRVLELVHSLGAARGVDLAVAAVGSPRAMSLAAALPRRGGTLNLFGLPEKGSRLDADLQELYLRGITVRPTYATNEVDILEVHRRLTAAAVSFDGLVTHREPLARLREGFGLAGEADRAAKVVITGAAW
jgi:L-iditol 2-dehydrogenase